MTLLEKLAELEHAQWSQWAKTLIETEPTLSSKRVKRWQELIVPYDFLPSEWKEFDREWAQRALKIVMEHLNEDTND